MPLITFDTCIFITWKPTKLPKGFRLSAVVLQELVAGANDNKEVKYWNDVRRAREEEKPKTTLLVPTGEDWWFVGKVLNSLQRGLKSKNGNIPKSNALTIQRITRDVLIARTSKREGATLITDNTKDFDLIKNFCNVKTIEGKDFF
jgi:predicted nucleic acid-binding protein